MTNTPINTSVPPVPVVSDPSASKTVIAETTSTTPTPPKKSGRFSVRLVMGVIGLLILMIGAGVGVYLTRQPQDVRQQAAGPGDYTDCARGTPHGGRACDTFTSYMTCNNGSYTDKVSCGSGQHCSNGGCVDNTPPGGGGGSGAYCDRSAPGASCTDKPAGAACTKNGQSGSCRVIVAGGANSECDCATGGGEVVPSPGTGGGLCSGTNCTAPPDGCIAVHHCAQLGPDGTCVNEAPQVVDGSVNAQQLANESCSCVQVDVLSGGSNSCVNGHINDDWSTLLGASITCPNISCNAPTPQPSPQPGNPSPAPSNQPDPTPQPSPVPTPPPLACGDSCTTSAQCPQDHSCSGNRCVLTSCSAPGTTCTTDQCNLTFCGATCAVNADCPNNHTCSNNTCVLTSCTGSGANCTPDRCEVTACGNSCTTNAQCPQNHTCSSNTCVLSACNVEGTTCTTDRCSVTSCGATCSANTDCPNNHTCSNNTCVLTACMASGANCDNDNCTVLPSPSPSPSPSPVPSPTPGLACNFITVDRTEIRVNDQVTFTCGSIAGASRYEFRVRLPNGSFQALDPAVANGNISAPMTISVIGDYRAQCRGCSGTSAATCQDWEPLN